MKAECPFCDKEHSQTIFQNEFVQIMYPLNPASAYHVLVIPKRHVVHLDDLSSEEWAAIGMAIKRAVNRAKRSISGFIGYNILSNNGDERVSQRVMHCHIHLFLRLQQEQNDPIRSRHTSSLKALTQEEQKYCDEMRELLA